MPLSQDQIETIWISLPPIRLRSYAAVDSECEEIRIRRYMWNTEICESLYPALHYFEIALRNNINSLVESRFKKDWFRAVWLGPKEISKIQEAEDKIEGEKKAVTPGRIVSELGLGFWVNLLSSYYERALWQVDDPVRKVFPYAARQDRQIRAIAARVNAIKDFRNRVFHHEAVWHRQCERLHDLIMETIRWMNPEIHRIASAQSKFPEVFRRGLSTKDSSQA